MQHTHKQMRKPIQIEVETIGRNFEPIKQFVSATKCLDDILPERRFYVHIGVGDDDKLYVVTDYETGRKIAQGAGMYTAICNARQILKGKTIADFEKHTQLGDIKRQAANIIREALSQSVSEYITAMEMCEALTALNKAGYRIIEKPKDI